MRSLAGLTKKVERIATQVPPRQESEPLFDYTLFTEAERTRLSAFLAILEERTPHNAQGAIVFREIPRDLFYDLSLWVHLQDALKKGDEERARGYRYRLTFATDDIITMFLSLINGHTYEQVWRQCTPSGMHYQYYEQIYQGEDEEAKARNLDTIWDWLINANVVEDTYHSNLWWSVQYKRPDWSLKQPW